MERTVPVKDREPQSANLSGGPVHGKLSYRAGDWRLVHQFEGNGRYVETMAHRSVAYR